MGKETKEITYKDLLTLWDELMIVPNSITWRLVTLKSGGYQIVQVDDEGNFIPIPLSPVLSLEDMYKFCSNLWLQEFKA